MAKLFANSGDPDQMPHSAASDLGLHCLPITPLGVSQLQWVKGWWACARMQVDLHLYTVKPVLSKHLWVSQKWLLKTGAFWIQVNFYFITFNGILNCDILMLSTLGKNFSRQHSEIISLFFPENRIWHLMQIVSSGATGDICMKCQILFSEKNKKKNHQFVDCWINQRVVKVNLYTNCLLLTLVVLDPDIPCICKQCRSRSAGFWRSQLIWICTVCH